MKYLFVLLIIISMESCEDFFRTTIKVDPPEHKPSLVVHMYISDSSDTIKASVSKSIGAMESVKNRRDLLVNDAIVRIKNNNDEVIYELKSIDPKKGSMVNYLLPLGTPFSGNNEKFKLELSQSALGTATAEQTMPGPVIITDPVFKKDAGHDLDGFPISSVSFDLHDTPGEQNYYQMKFLVANEAVDFSYYVAPGSHDPIYVNSYDYGALMLSDKTFDGKKFHVKLEISLNEENLDEKIYVDIQGISKDFYLFSKSLYLSMNSDDMGFVEPVSVYNNIKNGLGIFSLSSRRLYEVSMDAP